MLELTQNLKTNMFIVFIDQEYIKSIFFSKEGEKAIKSLKGRICMSIDKNYLSFLAVSVLVYLDCCNKNTINWVTYKYRNLFLIVPESRKSSKAPAIFSL